MPSLSSIILIAGLISSVLGQASTKTGYSGTLSSLSGGLEGTVTVVNPTTLKVSDYELQDASAPALYWWGSTTSTLKDGFRISSMHITTATTTPTDITVNLDIGKTTADFSTVGLWCEQFGIDFGQTTLASGSNSTAASTASGITSTTATAATSSSSTGAAVGMSASTSFGLFAGALAGALLI